MNLIQRLSLIGVLLMTGCSIFNAKSTGRRVTVIAHRGASAYAPENTLAAFALASKMKADYFELDVMNSRDGEVMVCHDMKVDRTTNGKGRVPDLTLAELKSLDAGSWYKPKFAGEKLPTLRESLELARQKKIGVYIEIKDAAKEDTTESRDKALEQKLLKLGTGRVIGRDAALAGEIMKAIEAAGSPNLPLTRKTIALIRETGMQKNVVVQSFSVVCCAVARIEAPELRVELLSDPKKPATWNTFMKFAKMLDVAGCNPKSNALTPERLKIFHDEGRTVAPWIVDKPEEMKKLADMGVDAIITNRPDVCLKLLKKNGYR